MIGTLAGVLLVIAPVIPNSTPLVSAGAGPVYDTVDGQLHDKDCYVSNDNTYYTVVSFVPTSTVTTASGTMQIWARTEYPSFPGVSTSKCTLRHEIGRVYTATFSDGKQAYTRTLTQDQYVSLGKKNDQPLTDQSTHSLLDIIL